MKIFTRARLLAAGLLVAMPALAQQVQETGDAYLENPAFNLTGNVLRTYNGNLGNNFKVSGIPTGDTLSITALGFYAGTNGEYTGAGTVVNSHTLSLWGPSATAGGNLSSLNMTNVTLSAGATVDANGFAWATLNPPIVLTNGDNYNLLASLTAGAANDAYLQPVDAGNNTSVALNGSPFILNEGAYNTSGGFAYSGATYLGPDMQYQITGPATVFTPQAETLYSTPGTISSRDNYSGAVGCKFTTGPTNVVVSHLGFYGASVNGLATSHNVAIFSGPAANPQILAQVVVPSGTAALYTNGYYWAQLNPPVLLNSNTMYFVAAQVANGDGDSWGDSATVFWNPFFVGGTTATTNAPQTAYGPGTTVWPPTQFSPSSSNTTYVVEGLGYIQNGPALAGVATTNATFSSGNTISVQGFSSGQQPVTNEWWEAGSPNVLISTTTSAYATLSIPGATAANDGTYFMTSSNALGGDQSANVTVNVTAYPVTITLEPTNETVFQNYETTFSMIATGSPPISYQWSGNGTPIPGAASTNYSLVATPANNGEVFSCQASNYINNTPYTATSSNVTLTVLPNLALPQEFLHGCNTNLSQNSFAGLVGGQFTVGSSSVTVTHLGYYAPTNQYTDATDCNLTSSHRVGIFNAAGTTLIGYVTVPSGTSPVVNGYIWEPLQPALVLSNNTQYLLAAEVFSATDPWGNTYTVPDLNPYFASACDASYWGAAWPGGGVSGKYPGQMYSAPNMAILAPATPTAYILPTNVVAYAGSNTMLTAYVGGQPPVTVQWYTNAVLLAGQTNLTLPLNNLTVASSSSNYYVIATGPGGSTQSGYGSVTVLPDSPTLTQDIQPLSQTAFDDQTVQFSVAAQGIAPLSYQWYFDASAISGATNSVLTLAGVSSNGIGSYYVIVTNSYGNATSSSASLSVVYPGPGTYPSVVMGPNLLLYYPLNDLNSGSTATNWGSLGFACDGSYFGGCSSASGPPQVNFGNNDNAVSLDGLSGCVILPPLTNSAGAASVVVSNITIAAWVDDTYPSGLNQSPNAAIFFQRSTYTFGLAVNSDPNSGQDALTYTWNGTQYNNFTGLDLPANQWALATMVISPTNSAVYLQYGSVLESTNFAASNPSATFAGNSYIGRDTAGSTRYWQGPIGDVMVFNRALSPTAVNDLYYGIVPAITLTISPVSNSQLTVTWSGGTLLQSTNLMGPWVAVPGAANGSGSYATKTSNNVEFYRVQE
ncbi:MAG TPA: hypothetical protein VGJ73_09075 [Verrucomicrobiae bacterium]